MMELLKSLTFVAMLGSALISGLLFVFSTSVMPAFGLLPKSEGIAAMRAINETILNPLFLSVFIGTAVVCVIVTILAFINASGMQQLYLIAGSLLYIVGCFLLTAFINVPMNEQLASADPNGTLIEALWDNYLLRWTFWNHIRTVASIAAAAFLAMAYWCVN